MELEKLFEEKRDLEEEIDNFFGDGEKFFGDRTYQMLLEKHEEIEESIKSLSN